MLQQGLDSPERLYRLSSTVDGVFDPIVFNYGRSGVTSSASAEDLASLLWRPPPGGATPFPERQRGG